MASTKAAKENTTARFQFPKGNKTQPKGMVGIGANDHVTIITKGRVSAFSDNDEEWNPGKHLTLEVTSCEIIGPEKRVSIDDAIKASRKKA